MYETQNPTYLRLTNAGKQIVYQQRPSINIGDPVVFEQGGELAVIVTGIQTSFCVEIAKEFNSRGIRTDVDDKAETTNKKIVESEKEWIPFTVLVGDKEVKEEIFMLRERNKKALEKVSKEVLISKLKNLQKDMPWNSLPLDMLISKRPIFV